MNAKPSANRWAADLNKLLDQVYADGNGRFPVNVASVAREISAQRYPNDPITMVQGVSLTGFDGALIKAPAGKVGWGIVHNSGIRSPGRVNFTLGHELGHYLLHRLDYPDGLKCGQQEMLRWDDYRAIEQEANCFAAGLLMPLHDFRRQIPPKSRPTLDDIGACANRYGVSLIAATLRWLEYAERRSVLVVSREGYILWARSTARALKTGAYYRTARRSPIEVPPASLAATAGSGGGSLVASHDSAWFDEPSTEIALSSDYYDFTMSLVHLEDDVSRPWQDEEPEIDTVDLMRQR